MSTPSLHHEVPGLRVVDSFCQLIDRLIVCRLKEFHFSRDSNKAKEAAAARAQAEELTEVATLYLAECVDGHREPRVHEHLRFHRHEAETPEAASLGAVISELTACHARYWEAQGHILQLRKEMGVEPPADYEPVYRDLHKWQLICDQANQRRSELITGGDRMLRDLLKRTNPCDIEHRVPCIVTGCHDWSTSAIGGKYPPLCARHENRRVETSGKPADFLSYDPDGGIS